MWLIVFEVLGGGGYSCFPLGLHGVEGSSGVVGLTSRGPHSYYIINNFIVKTHHQTHQTILAIICQK